MALGVIAGAFGAHSLKAVLSETSLQSWKTAVLYLLLHGLAMLILSIWEEDTATYSKYTRLSWKLFLGGIFLFSGSIFLLASKSLHGFPVSWAGPITPVGGVLFIAGWLNLLRLRAVEKQH